MDPASFDSIYELPIYNRRAEIVDSVNRNQVTIITAETGAGKSTQVPQYLAEHGYRKVIVTQPRILAARNLSGRVRQEYSWRRGSDSTSLVGYRTAHEQDDSPDNVILYCTDGLQLVRELTGSGINERQVLILDEIHEWNENMEVLIAWAKKRCQEEPSFKLVLMSATIEANSLAEYFGAPPPIAVEGRSYPVERRYSPDILAVIDEQLQRPAANILVFLPGKAEIEQTTEAIQDAAASKPIIPLHSQLEAEAQQKAFAHYPSGKIVLSTNIAQTSITIDDIDTVIDSGLERRAEVRSGVEGLFISEISQADCLQRAGRAGRTKAGVYILSQYDRLPCSRLEDRPAYGVPEIMRKHIDRLVLRLANVGIDIEALEFFHAPSRNTIKQAKRTLAALGATENGIVTATGHKMERFPVESSYGRMLVEAENYTAAVQTKLAAIISIQEVGGIVKGGPRYSGWQRYNHQSRSDLLAQYNVLLALPDIDETDYEDLGIIAKNIDKAREVNERLCRDLGMEYGEPTAIMPEEIEPLLKCIVAGLLHQIWALDQNGEAVHLANQKHRELSSTTVVRHAGLFAGTPFDLEIATGAGLEVMHLVNDITTVDPAWLHELAPGLFKFQPGKVYYDSYLGTLAARMQLKFRGRSVEVGGTPILERSRENKRLFVSLYAGWINQQLEKERMTIRGTHHQRVHAVPLKRIEEKIRAIAPGAISVAELPKKDRIQLAQLARLETWLGKNFMQHAHIASPGQGARHHENRSHGWRSRPKKDRWRNRD
ncbi:MAG TPA: helicase-related protein [Candidatus Saccharimonadales bacterium]|jgi:HrpA-like RNA helicase